VGSMKNWCRAKSANISTAQTLLFFFVRSHLAEGDVWERAMFGRITYKPRNSLTNRAVNRFSRTVFQCINNNNNNNNNRPTFPSNMIIRSSVSLMCWLNSKIFIGD